MTPKMLKCYKINTFLSHTDGSKNWQQNKAEGFRAGWLEHDWVGKPRVDKYVRTWECLEEMEGKKKLEKTA